MGKKCYSYFRFSSAAQRQGDSLRRQIELSKQFAQEKGLILDSELTMNDEGYSAYKGDHITKGALGNFLYLVKEGKIDKGSILLIESLDRLSREQVLDAFNQFISIINAGITIVTLQDRMEYSRESVSNDYSPLMFSLTIMARAHEESRLKSIRVGQAWENKRKNARNKIVTARCPHWLKAIKKENRFEIIPERREIINRIFDMYLSGMGNDSIAKTLNQEKIATWGRSKNGWGKSYIWKILRTRTIIGEYQPLKFNRDGEKVTAGDPIKDYYPAVIKENKFFEAQRLLKQNRTNFGKTGKCSNLFSHVLKCGYCGTSMTFLNKGKPPKGGKYLVCNNARNGNGCRYISVRYDDFQEAFFSVCNKLNLTDIITGQKSKKEEEARKLNMELLATSDQIDESGRKIKKWAESIPYSENIEDTLLPLIHDEKELQEALKLKLEGIKERIAYLEKHEKEAEVNFGKLKDSITAISKEDDQSISLRKRIKSEIQTLVEKIEIYPVRNRQENNHSSSFHILFKDGGVINVDFDSVTAQYMKFSEIFPDNEMEVTDYGYQEIIKNDQETEQNKI